MAIPSAITAGPYSNSTPFRTNIATRNAQAATPVQGSRRSPLDEALLADHGAPSCRNGTGPDSARMVLALEPSVLAVGSPVPAPEAECRVPGM